MPQQTLVNSGKRLIVLGGGLGGLSFAHYLRNFLAYYKKTHMIKKIIVIEAGDYMGGSVKSNLFDDNVVHELGPRSVRMSGAKSQNTCVLMDQLGLADRVLAITPKTTAGRDRYVYREGKLWQVPSSVWQIFKKMPATNTRLIRAVTKDLGNKKAMDLSPYPHKDPPLYDFIKYRLGEDAAESVLDPLLRGITAGDCRKLSTQAVFGDLLDKEQAYGGILYSLSKPPVNFLEHDELFVSDCLESKLLQKLKMDGCISFNLKTGLQTLPEHLSNALLNSNDDDVVAIYNQTRAINVKFSDEFNEDDAPCSVIVETIDGDRVKLDGDHLIASLPANAFTTILVTEGSSVPEEKLQALKYLPQIPHVPVGCVVVEYRNLNTKLPSVTGSFGFLTHSGAGSKVLGISFDSASFPSIDGDTGAFRMSAMMGGAWAEQVFGTTDMNKVTNAQLEQIALDEIRKILKIQDEPYRMSTILWKSGIAQYQLGHVAMLKQTREMIETSGLPLTLLGQSYDGVAVNDVIFSARRFANEFARSL